MAKAAGSSGGQPDAEFTHNASHLQQIQLFEKRLFAKSDGWRGGSVGAARNRQRWRRLCCAQHQTTISFGMPCCHTGGMFEEQLKKRNTYCMYVLCEVSRNTLAWLQLNCNTPVQLQHKQIVDHMLLLKHPVHKQPHVRVATPQCRSALAACLH